MTPWLRRPRPSVAEAQLLPAGGRTTKGTATPIPEVVLPPAVIFSLSKIQTVAFVSITTFMAKKHSIAFFPACFQETKASPKPYLFGG
jgi:hypothetical protein